MKSHPAPQPVAYETIVGRQPTNGLFRGREWLLAPEPFALSPAKLDELEALGHHLHAFNRACNTLYFEGARGGPLAWVAELLDRGKPGWLVDLQRSPAQRDALPAVIRPDLIVADEGMAATELDSVPGGIGVTAWQSRLYADAGWDVAGGRDGMLEGFVSVLGPDGDIIISREARDYRPEMEWAAEAVNAEPGRFGRTRPLKVIDTWDLEPGALPGHAYRYFELWDLENVEFAEEMAARARSGATVFTPPWKPLFEEKMWLALFWAPALREAWADTLGPATLEVMRKVVPRGWVIDPEPLPPFAEYHALGAQSWDDLKTRGLRERRFALKVSGFSETAWGSRGVVIGHDVPAAGWARAIDAALDAFPSRPHVLQRFHAGGLFAQRHYDRAGRAATTMQGRVRLCPYYFVAGGSPRLGGVMATVCPPDKKIIHGMRDAVIVPCSRARP